MSGGWDGGRDVSLVCGIGLHKRCGGLIRPRFGAPERECGCDCHPSEAAP